MVLSNTYMYIAMVKNNVVAEMFSSVLFMKGVSTICSLYNRSSV